jgi:nucleotide-binding universal stress UspA family protein
MKMICDEQTMVGGAGGPRLTETIKSASALEAGLPVMAIHGNTGVRHIGLGRVTERVMRHAHCPVVVVRGAMR